MAPIPAAADAREGTNPMLLDIVDLILDPDAYVCTWRDGELYIEPLALLSAVPAAA